MRIAQLTLNGYFNYGNVLQKYALNRVLRRYADAVEVIWHTSDGFLPESWEWNWRPQLTKMLNSRDERRRFTFELIRQAKFKEFNDRHVKTRFDVRALEDIADEYDFFVVGSDQVWHPQSYFFGRFLTFAPKEKRIAYAASIAIPQLPEQYKSTWREGILGMNHVSVREQGAVDIIRELTGVEPLMVVDPVFLLTAEEWAEVSTRPSWLDEKFDGGFILTYFLRASAPPVVKRLSTELKLPLINLLDPEFFNQYVVGPEEFLYLIAHATLLYTNSFHGTAFAILNRVPFVVMDVNEDRLAAKISARLPSLLRDFGLSERKATAENNYGIDRPLEIDYSMRDEVLSRERSKAFNFLDEALKGAAHED